MKRVLIAICALVVTLSAHADDTFLRPRSRITVTKDAYMAVLPAPAEKAAAPVIHKMHQGANAAVALADTQQGDGASLPAGDAPVAVDAPPAPLPAWEVKTGGWLRDTLADWSKREGWQLSWGLPLEQDFSFKGENTFYGDFPKAVTDLIHSLPASVHLRVQLVPDNKPPMVYVTADGDRK